MGIFSGGGFFGSGGKSATTTNTTQTNQQTASELENSLAVFGSDNQIVYTDFNAISEASRLAQTAVNAGREQYEIGAELSYRTSELFSTESNRALENVADFSNRFGDAAFSTVERALGSVYQSSQDALTFGEYALSESSAARQDALAATSGAQRNALEAVVSVLQDSFTSVTDFIGKLQGESQEQIGSTVTALNTIAREQSKSTDERVADIATSSMRYIVIGLGVLVAGFGLVYAFKGSK